MVALDLDFVRSQFPAVPVAGAVERMPSSRMPGGSYPCQQVVDRLTRFYRDRKVQPYGPYPGAQAGGAEMDEARTRLAAMMGVAREGSESFGPSTSANTYVLAQAVRKWLAGTWRRDRGDQSGP
jgi:selenocysteine lyase/cysteine desulfurase